MSNESVNGTSPQASSDASHSLESLLPISGGPRSTRSNSTTAASSHSVEVPNRQGVSAPATPSLPSPPTVLAAGHFSPRKETSGSDEENLLQRFLALPENVGLNERRERLIGQLQQLTLRFCQLDDELVEASHTKANLEDWRNPHQMVGNQLEECAQQFESLERSIQEQAEAYFQKGSENHCS